MPAYVEHVDPTGAFLATPLYEERTAVLPGIGDAVETLIDEIVRRWESATRLADVVDVNEISYQPMVPIRAHRLRVKLRMRGPGPPLPIKSLDQDE